jgi:hypothetical protein
METYDGRTRPGRAAGALEPMNPGDNTLGWLSFLLLIPFFYWLFLKLDEAVNK